MADTPRRLLRYGRSTEIPSMRLTSRDKQILEAIHAYDGLLSVPHIRRIFGMGKSQAEHRLKLLYQHRYLNRPSLEQRLKLPEMVYWLDRAGAELIASLSGTPFGEFSWRKEPRWSQVEHDLAVTDFRITLGEACWKHSELTLETWLPESEFWAYPDVVEYSLGNRTLRRRVRPDGFFTLLTEEHRLRYLLEIDRSTEDNPRFLREKIIPGIAYLKSEAYTDRFGYRSGRWVVVTTGERRMRNMLSQAARRDRKGIFYFTTFDKVTPDTILFEPIWWRTDRDEPVPLLWLD